MAVRATFELNDRPATDALRRIQTQGRETQATMDELGRTIDGVFSEKNVAEVKEYSDSIGSLQRNAKEAFGSLSRNAKEAQYSTVSSLREIDSSTVLLRENLDALGRERPTPTVNLNGVTEALGQLELLEERIDKLSRQRATPGVSVPSASGGGGNFGRATGRSGSSHGHGGLDIPFAGTVPWSLVGGALAAAPPLVGAATGLIGSAGAAALGAGSIGVAGYGVAGTSAALAAPTAYVAIKSMKEASTALAAYQKQVMLTGPSSKAAEEKLRSYNLALQTAAPGTGQFLKARTLLGEEFTAATKPGQRDITAIGTRALNLGRQLTPLTSELSNEFLGEARVQSNNFAGFLNNDRSRSFYTEMAQEGTRDLEPAEQTLEHVAGTIENIARAARPFFHEGVLFLDHWTEGWKSSTDDIGNTRQEIGGFVDQLKSWAHLGGAGFDLVRDLLAPASGSGQTMVDDLTEQLESWDRWVQENPREISNFFHESAEGTEKIATALGKIVELLWNTGRALQPILEQGANIVSLLGNAGLLTPGAAPFLIAGGRGVQNAKQGLGQRLRGTGSTTAAGAPVVAGSPRSTRWGAFGTERYGAPLGLSEMGEAYGLEREGSGVLRSGLTVARGTRLGGAVESFGRGVVGSLAPYAALSFGLGAAGTRGNFLERVAGGANAATFGIFPAPNKTEEAEKGSTQAAYIAHRITAMKGLSLEQKQNRLYDALAHTVEIGTQGIGPETLSEAEAKAREHSLAQYRGQYREYVEGRRGQRGEEVLGGIQQAFGTRSEHGVKGAGRTAISAIEGEAKTMHGKTLREFDQMGMEWAQELAKANPKLKGVVNELAENIEARFQRMGQQVQIIHGHIVDTSERSWSKVRQLIGTETQLAYSEANKNLTALEQRAFAILKHMGYSAGEAQSIVHEAQTGRPTKTGSAIGAEAHHHGESATTLNNMPAGAKPNATGGRRLPMPLSGSLGDDLYIGNGEKAAGGELIANRHTERAVDRLLSPYGTSLGLMVANEGRTHSTPFREYARGGRRSPRDQPQTAWRGLPPTGLHSGIEKVASAVLGHFPGLSVTSTTGGTHVPGSLHYAGEAVDVAGDTQTMFDASQWIKSSGLYRQLTEGIHNPNLSVSDGHFVPDSYYAAVWAEHANHIHLGVAHAVGALGALAGGRGGRGGTGGSLGRVQQIKLNAPHSGRGGIPGAAVDRAGALEAAGLQKNINKILAKRGGGATGGMVPSSGGPVIAQIGRGLLSHGLNRIGAAGIIGNALQESGWNPGAVGSGGGGLWGFTASPYSLADLQAYASQQGRPWADAGLQTQFLLKFLSGGLKSKLNAAGSPGAAAALFMNEWERPAVATENQARREQGAEQAFQAGFATGGRRQPGFAGWFQHGGHFRVKNPTLFGAGEGGVGERVSVEPLHSPGRTGTNHFHFKVDLRGAHIGGEGDAKRLARKMAEEAADHLADLLEKGDGVSERELTG